jgi:MoaA/NifB/PqqE/SkfB family radical SAM enzyme
MTRHTLAEAKTSALTWLGGATNRTLVLPLVVFFPTSRCNSRCLSCAWWQTTGEDDLSLAEIEPVAESAAALGTKLVVFSGGEPLLRPDVFEVADLFRRRGIALHLLTSGVGLAPRVADVARHFTRVVVSLDGSSEGSYRDVRGIAALSAVETGVARLRRMAPEVPVIARATLHKANFRELPRLIAKAHMMRLDAISFLAADVASGAFGPRPHGGPRALLLDRDDIAEFRALIDACVADRADDFASGFIVESPAKLRRLPQYYAAMLGDEAFPPTACNAPWVSAVVEANGAVRPCFFHPPIGNVRETPLPVLVRDHLRAFRAGLDVTTNAVCRGCVCSLKVTWRNAPWS